MTQFDKKVLTFSKKNFHYQVQNKKAFRLSYLIWHSQPHGIHE